MKLIKFNNNPKRKFQAGGEMAVPVEDPNAAGVPVQEVPMEGEPMEGQGGQEQDPLLMIAQLFAQGLQNQDCNALAQGAQMFLELISQAQGGAEGGAPVFGKGGRLIGYKPVSLKLVRN